eukprot:1200627-Rhodomonas_salina.1
MFGIKFRESRKEQIRLLSEHVVKMGERAEAKRKAHNDGRCNQGDRMDEQEARMANVVAECKRLKVELAIARKAKEAAEATIDVEAG